MLDPKNMWLAMAAFALVFVGWKTLQPAPDVSQREPYAVVSVGYGDQMHVETITKAQCLSAGDRIWVTQRESNDCTTVLLPPSLLGSDKSAETVLIFIDGDVPEADHTAAGEVRMRASYKRMTETLSDKFGLPVLVVSRPGILGSSGVHLAGGKRDDSHIVDAALDELKRKYAIKSLILAGQSGGSRMIAQLLVLGRRDITCAVMGSGAYDAPRRQGSNFRSTNIFGDPGRSFLVPLREVANIQTMRSRRLFMVGDREDKITAFDEQQAWTEKLVSLGHHAVLVEGKAKDADHHGLAQATLEAAGLCAKGKPDAEVVAVAGRRVALATAEKPAQ